jgi:hypothetical protein
VVNDEWPCGQFMAALSISQNVAWEPILWWRFRQAAPISDRTVDEAVAVHILRAWMRGYMHGGSFGIVGQYLLGLLPDDANPY